MLQFTRRILSVAAVINWDLDRDSGAGPRIVWPAAPRTFGGSRPHGTFNLLRSQSFGSQTDMVIRTANHECCNLRRGRFPLLQRLEGYALTGGWRALPSRLEALSPGEVARGSASWECLPFRITLTLETIAAVHTMCYLCRSAQPLIQSLIQQSTKHTTTTSGARD